MPGTRDRGLDLFRVFGVEVALYYSWFIVFLLVTWSLTAGYFPQQYPGHGWPAYLLVGLVAAFLFFASVLLHELAHAAVANRLGQQVRRITLFIFGGVAHLSREPPGPGAEFEIAAVGPIASLLLGALFWLLFRAAGELEAGLWTGMLRYLAFINVALGLFNLLPGFPLDGGRLLRALFWWRSGSLQAATRRAADWGSGIALGLMFLGAVQILSGTLVGGLWLIFIGMFLRGAAHAEYQAMLVEQVLDRIPVNDVMGTEPVTIDPDATVADAVEDYFLRYAYAGFPVRNNGRVLGLVTLAEVQKCPPAERARRSVRDIMRPQDESLRVAPSTTVSEALRRMEEARTGRLLVMDGNELRGMVTRSGIARFLQLKTAAEIWKLIAVVRSERRVVMPILEKLAEFLDGHRIHYTILTHSPAYTAEQVAAAQHVPGREIAKVVMVKAGERFGMAVLPATRKLDVKKLPIRDARLATEAEFMLFPKCEVGAMPPFGNLWGLPVHVDESLARDEEIVFNAGTHTQTVRMKYADFARLVKPTVEDYTLRREQL